MLGIIVFLVTALFIIIVVFTFSYMSEMLSYRKMYQETITKLTMTNNDAAMYKRAVYDIIESLDRCKKLEEFKLNLEAFHERLQELESGEAEIRKGFFLNKIVRPDNIK